MIFPIGLVLFAIAALNYPVMGSAPALRQTTEGTRQAVVSLREAGWDGREPAVVVDIARQRLLLFEKGAVSHAWQVSTSKYGVGYVPGSYKTPVGLHRIWRKAGAAAKLGQPLKNGEPTDAPVAEEGQKKKVFISTRALMLDGLEKDNQTSKSRGIWIHGTTAEEKIGQPASIGCVRMRNVDVIQLFDFVREGTLVYITDRR